jgi:hypothetical protein
VCEPPGPPDPDPQTKTITVGCRNNVTADVSMLPFDLTVDPGPIAGGQSVSVIYDGVANFAEAFLDAAQAAVPGGVRVAALVDLVATTQVRSGGTFPNVPLTADPSTLTGSCDLMSDGSAIDSLSNPLVVLCNPANNNANGSNAACIPTGAFNQCRYRTEVPTTTNQTTCTNLGKASQWNLNGFCVTGDLALPLSAQASSGTAGASGQILFGWYDSATVCPPNFPNQGTTTCTLPAAVFSSPAAPLGIRVNASGLSVALQCNQAVDATPTGTETPVSQPDSALIPFPIQ